MVTATRQRHGGRFHLRLPEPLLDRARLLAQREDRPLSGLVRVALQRELDRREARDGAPQDAAAS